MKVRIGQSGIPGAGKGLFAMEPIKRGQTIVKVTGKRYTTKEVIETQSHNNYLLELNDESGDCIDVEGPARYANDAKGLTYIEGIYNNAQFCSDEDHTMYLTATRTIAKGQEIFVSYGKAYWRQVKKEQQLQAAAGR